MKNIESVILYNGQKYWLGTCYGIYHVDTDCFVISYHDFVPRMLTYYKKCKRA
jgi:hypothetical protein